MASQRTPTWKVRDEEWTWKVRDEQRTWKERERRIENDPIPGVRVVLDRLLGVAVDRPPRGPR